MLLCEELCEPRHKDIFDAANKEATFEGSMGCIAAMLDIALDGTYEPEDLFGMLTQALRNRGGCVMATDLASGLVEVELRETADAVTMEFAGGELDIDVAQKQAALSEQRFSIFMQEQGCKICENKQACAAAGQCLGKEAYEVGGQEE